MSLSKKIFRLLSVPLAVGLACAAAIYSPYLKGTINRARAMYTLKAVANDLKKDPKRVAIQSSALVSAFNVLGADALSLGKDNALEIHYSTNAVNGSYSIPTVCLPSSLFMEQFYSLMPATNKQFVLTNTGLIVFSPNLSATNSGISEDVNGLYLSNRVIAVSTQAENGKAKNPLQFPAVLIHEADHAYNSGLEGRLDTECRAIARSLTQLAYQRAQSTNLLLKGMHEFESNRLKVGQYLDKFGDFSNVYPLSHILARDLLLASISQAVAAKYAKMPVASEMDRELAAACVCAQVVLTNSRENATRILYNLTQGYPNTIVQVSACSALQFLYPDMLRQTGSADYPVGETNATLNFSDSALSIGTGSGYISSSKQSEVTGLPSLAELLRGRRYREYNANSSGESKTTIYELAPVNRIMVDYQDKNSIVLIPSARGAPSSEFIPCYAEAVDLNQNGRADAITVYYVNPRMLRSDGSALGKIDWYDGQGKFVKSSLSFCSFSPGEGKLNFDIQELCNRWQIEKIDLTAYLNQARK